MRRSCEAATSVEYSATVQYGASIPYTEAVVARAVPHRWKGQLSSAGSVAQEYQGKLFRSREHRLLVPDNFPYGCHRRLWIRGYSAELLVALPAELLTTTWKDAPLSEEVVGGVV